MGNTVVDKKVFDEIIRIVTTHEAGDGDYCDTGEDMNWRCRSHCVDHAVHRLNKAYQSGLLDDVGHKRQRTSRQNNSLHKYCELLAEALNDSGQEMKAVLAVKSVDVPWDKNRVKEVLWRPLQEAMTGKTSTTEQNTVDVSEIYAVLDRHISENCGVHVPWPSNEPPMI